MKKTILKVVAITCTIEAMGFAFLKYTDLMCIFGLIALVSGLEIVSIIKKANK